jgi:quercetin dioxygenase-like cupin family protein
MIVSHVRDVVGNRPASPELNNVLRKVLISPKEGWEGYVMRLFELGEDGYSPKHIHDWPHINFILGGQGVLHLDGQDYELEEGSFAYVPGGKIHQFRNTGKDPFSFICIVPEEGDK